MKVFRIGNPSFPLFSGEGARMVGGRWNSPSRAVIYASDSLSTCLLEILVHTQGIKPPNGLSWISIEIPKEVSQERVLPADLPGWDDLESPSARQFGDQWLDQNRNCILWVPSLAARDLAWNVVINVAHPDFSKLEASSPIPVILDPRLFA